MPVLDHQVPIRRLTEGRHHFFGYYDKHAWDATQRFHLALEVPFDDRMPRPDDEAVVGMVDLEEENRFIPLDTTSAWCWQQGCMLQWLGSAPDREIIYNVRVGTAFRARIRDVHTGRTRDLARPIYCVTSDGRRAATLNFSRVHWCRPGYGYAGIRDPNRDEPAPEDDGVWTVDLATGAARLIVSIGRLASLHPHPTFSEARHHWVNHLLWNADGSRLILLHRWQAGQSRFTRMYTVGPDGEDLHLVPAEDMVSHFHWRGTRRILAWARTRAAGDHFYLFEDRSDRWEIVGKDVLTGDGHCSFGPDGRWVLCDTYPQGEPPSRTLYLYRLVDDTRFDLGRFAIDERFPSGPLRTDLHPRWSRDGTQVSFDSAHEGARQIYLACVAEVGEPEHRA